MKSHPYTIVFNNGKPNLTLDNSSFLSYFVKGDKYRSDVAYIIIDL